jgi:[ribosomal protein S5]-alanine N-acetyltransferase
MAGVSDGLLPHRDVGSGSPVVLLHAFGLDNRMWAAQVAALRPYHRVVVPDLPGFGPQGAERGEFSPAQEVFRLLAAKSLGPVHVVGVSYGGAIAADLAVSHPEAVKSLVLIDALLGEPAAIDGWATCVDQAMRGDLVGARDAWLQAEPFRHSGGSAEMRAEFKQMVDAYKCGHWRGTVQTRWEQPKPKPLLERVRCPSLILVGEKDSPTFQGMAKAYAATVPGARLIQLEGLGHMAPMEGPERVNKLLLDFLQASDGGLRRLPSSPRVEFRTWKQAEWRLGMALWGDPRVTTFITARPFTPAEVEARVQEEVERHLKHGVQYGPVFLRTSGELVGCCGFRPRPAPDGVLELGFLLRPHFWRKGLATEAASAAVEHAFAVLGAPAIFAGHHPENSASRHVLEKLGFRQTHLEYYPPTALWHPSYLLTPADFRPQHAPE